VPTALHRKALEACARTRTTTVSLLSEVVDASSAVMLFEWLAEQSYVSAGPSSRTRNCNTSSAVRQ
jgi:hypothetical protein